MDDFDTVQTDAPPEFQAPEAEETEKGFPSFRYGPDGQSAVFQSAKDVPSGWHDHPSKVKGAPDPSKVEAEPRRPGKAEIMKDLKRANIPFNPMSAASDLWSLLKASAPAAPSPLTVLRREFKELTGKNPSPKLKADELQAKIDALKAS